VFEINAGYQKANAEKNEESLAGGTVRKDGE
jgi:hypothetical protein